MLKLFKDAKRLNVSVWQLIQMNRMRNKADNRAMKEARKSTQDNG